MFHVHLNKKVELSKPDMLTLQMVLVQLKNVTASLSRRTIMNVLHVKKCGKKLAIHSSSKMLVSVVSTA